MGHFEASAPLSSPSAGIVQGACGDLKRTRRVRNRSVTLRKGAILSYDYISLYQHFPASCRKKTNLSITFFFLGILSEACLSLVTVDFARASNEYARISRCIFMPQMPHSCLNLAGQT